MSTESNLVPSLLRQWRQWNTGLWFQIYAADCHEEYFVNVTVIKLKSSMEML